MEHTQLKPRQLNSDILSSIKAARQKLSVDLTKQNSKPEGLYRPGNQIIEKTIEMLKLKVEALQKDKQDLAQEAAQQRKSSQHEVDILKQQLTKYIEKDFELSLGHNSSAGELQKDVERMRDALARKDVELQVTAEKLRQAEGNFASAQESIKKLNQDIEQLNREKDKHIELSINDKIAYEEEMKKCLQESDWKLARMRKFQMDNINLKKELHSLSTQQRAAKIYEQSQKKSQEQYEFELKELTQKFNSKVARYQKQLSMLRKTINTLKDRNDNSDVDKLAQAEKDIQTLKERILELQRQLAFKNIQMDKLNSKIESQAKIMQQKDGEYKKLQQGFNKKQQSQRNLMNKLAKCGLQPSQKLFVTKTKFDFTNTNPKFFSNADSDTPTFTKQEQTQPVTLPDRGYSSDKGGGLNNERRQSLTSQIVREERAIADLRATHKNLSSDMSLSQIMQQIKRKNEKISHLRQGKE